jgi:hypothetical protein
MIPSLADPARSQAVRWTAVQAINAIENFREGAPLSAEEIEILRTLGDDLIGAADWTKWVREESFVSSLFANDPRLNEAVLRDASDFTPRESEEFRRLSLVLNDIISEQGGVSDMDLDAIEDACSLLIRRLESRARFTDRPQDNPAAQMFRSA